jgi:hypothetical protein
MRRGGVVCERLVGEMNLRGYDLHINAYVTKPLDSDVLMVAVPRIDTFFGQTARLSPLIGQARTPQRPGPAHSPSNHRDDQTARA